jgi:hypothetical protein
MIVPTESPAKWLRYADWRYLAARYLFFRGLQLESLLANAHALELFLKTYLGLKDERLPETHDLTHLYEACAAHDRRFIAYLEDPNWCLGTVGEWANFWRYPESKRRQRSSVWGTDDVFRLDSVARLVHLEVDPVNSQETEIRRLMLGYRISALAVPDYDPEIRSLFIRLNNFFDEDGSPLPILPERAWKPAKPSADWPGYRKALDERERSGRFWPK